MALYPLLTSPLLCRGVGIIPKATHKKRMCSSHIFSDFPLPSARPLFFSFPYFTFAYFPLLFTLLSFLPSSLRHKSTVTLLYLSYFINFSLSPFHNYQLFLFPISFSQYYYQLFLFLISLSQEHTAGPTLPYYLAQSLVFPGF